MEKTTGKRIIVGVLLLTLLFGLSNFSFAQTTREGEEIRMSETSGTFRVLTYNVAGLPAIISEGDPGPNTKKIGTLMNQFDIVAVQEDFHYHHELVKTAVNFPYRSYHLGSVPKGDGINIFSKFPMGKTTRYKWNKTHGVFSDGSDELTPKGFSFNRVQVAPGAYIDIYNLHADAGRDTGSTEARHDNFKQLAGLMNKYSAGNAVIVMGDTNSRYLREEDKLYELLIEPTGLQDAWVEAVRDGVYPEPDTELLEDIEENAKNPEADKDGPNHEEVDKIFFRSGRGVQLTATAFEVQDEIFADTNGDPLSDHFPFSTTFEYTTSVPETNKVYLSDMKVRAAFNGWGPVEYDSSNGEKDDHDGRGLNILGSTFTKGLGVHANSSITYDLKGEFTRFQSYIGLDNEKRGGTVVFEVLGDGRSLYKSGVFTDKSRPKFISLDVTGVRTLTLIVDQATNGNKNDHADWAEAAVLRAEDTEEGFMVNDSDRNIRYSGNFAHKTNRSSDYMDDIHQTTEDGDKYTYTFYGTGIDVIGVKDKYMGDQLVTVDGVSYGVFNAKLPNYTSNQRIFEVRNLPLGNHTIEVEKVSDSWMLLDAFRVYKPIPTTTYLSDLPWDFVVNGYGPAELDMSNGEKGKGDGRTLTINGRRFSKGLGVHAYSEIRYDIGKKYSRFQSYIGLDDEVNKGKVMFKVFADGREIYRSSHMDSRANAAFVDLDVTGVSQLMLVVVDVDGKSHDHADWADAKLIR